MQLGRSSTLRVGQQTFAVGNPFGFLTSLSTGVLQHLCTLCIAQAGTKQH